MIMYKAYYLITWREGFADLLRSRGLEEVAEQYPNRTVVAISQGGFGEGVVDYSEQVKLKFLEYISSIYSIQLPLSEETFDNLFELEEPDDFVDLDERESLYTA